MQVVSMPQSAAEYARAPRLERQSGAESKMRETARQYESFFLQQMLDIMTSAQKPDEMFGGGQGEVIFRSMLNEHYGKAIAGRGGIGIAEGVYREMLRMQEAGKS